MDAEAWAVATAVRRALETLPSTYSYHVWFDVDRFEAEDMVYLKERLEETIGFVKEGRIAVLPLEFEAVECRVLIRHGDDPPPRLFVTPAKHMRL
jgi:hypothetical protein